MSVEGLNPFSPSVLHGEQFRGVAPARLDDRTLDAMIAEIPGFSEDVAKPVYLIDPLHVNSYDDPDAVRELQRDGGVGTQNSYDKLLDRWTTE